VNVRPSSIEYEIEALVRTPSGSWIVQEIVCGSPTTGRSKTEPETPISTHGSVSIGT
jgi:hypothetical protein